jgi:alkylation response protein AidB-like acyl-CoA dehydrogenase
MRLGALRTLAGSERGALGREALVTKLHWATVHRGLGELAMDVLGAAATVCGEGPGETGEKYDPTPLQRLFLFSRADTIYGGSNQIQRNVIGERALGLPKEPK